MLVKSYFLAYLLLPLVVIVSAAILSVVNQKNQFINNRKLITAILILGAILGLPGVLGLLGINFMPVGYLICILYELSAGSLIVYVLTYRYPTQILTRKLFILATIFITSALGYYLYYLLFDWLSNHTIAAWAATSVFYSVIPVFFWWTYIALISIPHEIYKTWRYPSREPDFEMDHLDFNRMFVLELEVYKNISDAEPIKVKVKAPGNMVFGDWFFKFIDDYNLKFPNSGVSFTDEYDKPYQWIFFLKTSFFKKNLFIDPELNILQNHITEKATIYAKRVSEDAVAAVLKGDESIFI